MTLRSPLPSRKAVKNLTVSTDRDDKGVKDPARNRPFYETPVTYRKTDMNKERMS